MISLTWAEAKRSATTPVATSSTLPRYHDIQALLSKAKQLHNFFPRDTSSQQLSPHPITTMY
jgi:hypothetical protein